VHVNAEEPICFLRNQDVGGAHIKTYLKNENIIDYDEKYIHSWPLHPYDALIDLIKEKKWDKLSIGLEMDSHYFTAYCYQKIKNGLPNVKILDCERLVNWVRVIKSNSEIKYMKAAALIAQLGMKKAYEVINPGVRQFMKYIILGAALAWAMYMSDKYMF
jgi:Xaa-Pro dipeptidase/ectoine hydrolase